MQLFSFTHRFINQFWVLFVWVSSDLASDHQGLTNVMQRQGNVEQSSVTSRSDSCIYSPVIKPFRFLFVWWYLANIMTIVPWQIEATNSNVWALSDYLDSPVSWCLGYTKIILILSAINLLSYGSTARFFKIWILNYHNKGSVSFAQVSNWNIQIQIKWMFN